MNPSKPCKKARKRLEKHGLTRMKHAVKELGKRAIDGRTAVGKALLHWRSELIEDLGGADSVSTQQLAIVDL